MKLNGYETDWSSGQSQQNFETLKDQNPIERTKMYKQRMIYKYESQCEWICMFLCNGWLNEWMDGDGSIEGITIRSTWTWICRRYPLSFVQFGFALSFVKFGIIRLSVPGIPNIYTRLQYRTKTWSQLHSVCLAILYNCTAADMTLTN